MNTSRPRSASRSRSPVRRSRDRPCSVHVCAYVSRLGLRTRTLEVTLCVTGLAGIDRVMECLDDNTRLWHLSASPELSRHELRKLYRTIGRCEDCQEALVDLCQPNAYKVTDTQHMATPQDALTAFHKLLHTGEEYMMMVQHKEWMAAMEEIQSKYYEKFGTEHHEQLLPFVVFQNLDEEPATLAFVYK